jgi:effector-binding domain-containing protein
MPDRDPVDDVLRRITEVEIPADIEARMRRQFTEFRTRLDRGRRPAREWAASLVGRQPFRWAAAGAVLATVLIIPFVWGGAEGGRVYAAAVSRLADARSVRYTMELAPFVTVEFSHLAPTHDRVRTSWGIEVRTDGSGTQLVLLHGSRQYVREQKSSGGVIRTADLIEQLTSLPKTADTMLGERTMGGRRFVGYRVLGTRMPGAHDVESLDLWLDAGSGALDHVDLTPAGAGASGYQMHVRDIRVDADLDTALFDMTPPAGYSDARSEGTAERPVTGPSTDLTSLRPQITQADQQSAIVIPMSGSFLQASAVAASVSEHLRQRGIVPTGPAFGQFASESRWVVGYPVPSETTTASPFEVINVPAGPVASVVVNGPWGQRSAARWSRLLTWVGEQGYIAIGPPTEVWSGDETHPDLQATEMRIAVAPVQR